MCTTLTERTASPWKCTRWKRSKKFKRERGADEGSVLHLGIAIYVKETSERRASRGKACAWGCNGGGGNDPRGSRRKAPEVCATRENNLKKEPGLTGKKVFSKH